MQRIERAGERRLASVSGEEYFDQVYRATVADLHRYIIIKTSHAENVEDILQEVYKAFYLRVLKKGHEDILSPKAFLTESAKKELARHYRAKSKHAEQFDYNSFDEGIEAEGIPFDELIHNRQALSRVYEVVKQMPLISYKAFMLFYSYDMPTAVIAEKLGISEENVRIRLWRARNIVRKEVKP